MATNLKGRHGEGLELIKGSRYWRDVLGGGDLGSSSKGGDVPEIW